MYDRTREYSTQNDINSHGTHTHTHNAYSMIQTAVHAEVLNAVAIIVYWSPR